MSPSLWDIEASILGLAEIMESQEVTEEERAAARSEMERWVKAEVGKVDRIRGFLKHCAMMEASAKDEAEVMQVRANIWENRARRLKDLVLAAMGASGQKRIEGRTGLLRVQANGGKLPLKITRADLVPENLVGYYGFIAANAWGWLRSKIGTEAWNQWSGRQDVQMERRPMQEAIRKALEMKCAVCDGEGHYEPTGEMQPKPCSECNGTGRGTVPGAELEPRQNHLRCE